MFYKPYILSILFFGSLIHNKCSSFIEPTNKMLSAKKYSVKNDRKNVEEMLKKSYIIHRAISEKELEEISDISNIKFKTALDVLLFSLNMEVPDMYVIQEESNNNSNKKTVGFVRLLKCSYYEEPVYEIGFFGFDEPLNNATEQTIKEKLLFMLNFTVDLAKKADIKKLRIDFQKNESELVWVPYFQEFGFTFAQHSFLEDGVTGQYIIES